jgi:hypothetical protein
VPLVFEIDTPIILFHTAVIAVFVSELISAVSAGIHLVDLSRPNLTRLGLFYRSEVMYWIFVQVLRFPFDF